MGAREEMGAGLNTVSSPCRLAGCRQYSGARWGERRRGWGAQPEGGIPAGGCSLRVPVYTRVGAQLGDMGQVEVLGVGAPRAAQEAAGWPSRPGLDCSGWGLAVLLGWSPPGAALPLHPLPPRGREAVGRAAEASSLLGVPPPRFGWERRGGLGVVLCWDLGRKQAAAPE